MIEIQLNDKVVEVKEEMTISQYQNYQKYKELYDKEPGRLLAMYLNVSYNELKDIPKPQVDFVQNYLTGQMMGAEYKDETHFKFTHNGTLYGLENDWAKLAWGAWVDLEVFTSDNLDENIHRIMAILYRPITEEGKKKYKIEPYKSDDIEDRAEIFKELPIKYWFGAASFFFLVSNKYIINMQNSLNTTLKINKWILTGWNKMPKWIRNRIPLDSILISPTNLQETTSQKWSK